MKPSIFPEGNKVLTRPPTMLEGECADLLVYSDGGQCISKWTMSWRERLSALFFGVVWLGVLGGGTQPPVWLVAQKEMFDKVKVEKTPVEVGGLASSGIEVSE